MNTLKNVDLGKLLDSLMECSSWGLVIDFMGYVQNENSKEASCKL